MRCHESTQTLCSFLQPICPNSDIRHQYDSNDKGDARVMRYDQEVGTGGSYEEDQNEEAYHEERRGVHHLVCGWVQQAQAEKVRFKFSSDIVV